MSQDDGADLTLLLETLDPVELAGVRGLLDGHEIRYVVQGELHASMLGGMMGNPAIVPRVLVAKRDLEAAQALLQATPEAETQPQPGAALEGAACPVHLKDATATCGRCGTFLCADCKALGSPPLCEDCSVSEEWMRKPRQANAATLKKTVAWVLLAPVLIGVFLGLLAVIGMFLR